MPSVLGHWMHSAPDESFPYGLHKAAHAGDLLGVLEMEEDLGSFLTAEGALHQTIDAHGRTPLFYAAQGGHVQIVRVMLRAHPEEAALNEADEHGSTALHAAAGAGHVDVVVLLIDGGSPMDVRDKLGATPLMNAAECGHVRVFRRLLEAGCDLHSRDGEGISCFMAACLYGHARVVREVMHRGYNIEETVDGQSALFIATMGLYGNVVHALLNGFCDMRTVPWPRMGGHSSVGEMISPELMRVKAMHSEHFACVLFFAFICGRHPRMGMMCTGALARCLELLDVVQTVLAQGLAPMKGCKVRGWKVTSAHAKWC